MQNCECAVRGIPEEFICGSPDCPRTMKAINNLDLIAVSFPGPRREAMEGCFSLPDNRYPCRWSQGD